MIKEFPMSSSGLVKKVHMIILMQADLQAAIDFYTQLGLKLVFHIKDAWAEMKLGDVKIGLCPTSTVIDGHRTGVVLEVEDLHQVYEQYKDKIIFVNEPKEAVHGIMVSFKDPGGNIVDLYQPTPQKLVELIKKTEQEDKDELGQCSTQKGCCKDSDVCN